MNLSTLLHEWDADTTVTPPMSRSSRRTITREGAAGHQPREHGCHCGRCGGPPDVWSVHGVCDRCGPYTCRRCEVAA